MQSGIADIIEHLPAVEKKIHHLSDVLLANLVMVSEIPAPTFDEENRMRFLVNRFTESNLINCSTDEMGNALGILPGKVGKRNILLAAHMDTIFDHSVDHTVTIYDDKVTGPGVGDNSLGVAVLATLPACLEYLHIHLDSNLILMGSSRCLGKGNVQGLNFFLENSDLPIHYGLCVEGMKLGRLSYSSIGMKMCEIHIEVPEEYDWTLFGTVGSIVTLHNVIDRILKIPLPRKPRSRVILGSVEGGKGFNKIATKAVIRLEIRSESGEIVEDIYRQLENIVAEIGSDAGEEVNMNIVSQCSPGGLTFNHPLVVLTRELMNAAKIKPRISPSTSDLTAFIAHSIPALTLGLTDGDNLDEMHSTIYIEPVYKGLALLLGAILAVDKGYCDGPQ
ncbi:MAG: peptidase [Spirochaetales bacterium]|nr:peptidase [Spirochaetales bacterium]